MRYEDTVTTATFRTFDNAVVKEMKAKGFQSQYHAQSYFTTFIAEVALEIGQPVWLSNLVCTNGDFLCEAVPRFWRSGVKAV
jgi:hypothetical protein